MLRMNLILKREKNVIKIPIYGLFDLSSIDFIIILIPVWHNFVSYLETFVNKNCKIVTNLFVNRNNSTYFAMFGRLRKYGLICEFLSESYVAYSKRK